MSVNINNNVEKDTTLLVFFFSLKAGAHKSQAAMRFSSIAFGLPHLLIELFHMVGLWCGRMVGWSLGRCMVTSLPNFLGWVDLLRYGAPQEGV